MAMETFTGTRRSTRMRTDEKGPENDAKYYIEHEMDLPGLSSKFISEEIGCGVFNSLYRSIYKGSFVLEYAGELITKEAADNREKEYAKKGCGSYMFYFKHERQELCVDATEPSGRLGRLVNDSKLGNCKMQKVMVGQVPHLCLFATRTITQGEELRYDYGLDDLPWRKQEGVAKGKRKKTLKADHEEIGQAKSQEKQREGVAKGKRKKTLKADHEEIGQAKSQEKLQQPSKLIQSSMQTLPGGSQVNDSDDEKNIDQYTLLPLETLQEGVAKGKRKKTLKADHEEIGQAKSQEKQQKGVAKGKRKKTLKADHEEIGQAKSQEKQQEVVVEGKRKKTLKADHEEIGQAKSQGKQQHPSKIIQSSMPTLPGDSQVNDSDDEKNIDQYTLLPLETLQEVVVEGKRKKTLKADHEEIGQAKSQGKQQHPSKIIQSSMPTLPGDSQVNDSDDEKNIDQYTLLPLETLQVEETGFKIIESEIIGEPLEDMDVKDDSGLHGDFPEIESTGDEGEGEECNLNEDPWIPEDSDGSDDSDDPTYDYLSSEEESDSEDTESSDGVSPQNNKDDSSSDKKLQSTVVNVKRVAEFQDDIQVVVPRATKTDIGCRRYDKTYSCYFCGIETAKLPRHLRTRHKDEPEVLRIEAIAEKKLKSKELDRIRLKGDFYHNLNVMKSGGVLKVIRRPNPNDDVSFRQFVPCTHCLGFVQKHELWRHVTNCQFNEKIDDSKHSKLRFESEMLLYGSKDTGSTVFTQSILSIMRQDPVSFEAKRDDLILKFGHSLFEKGGSAKATYITQKMRSLARLLMEVREVTNNGSADLSDFITPTHFDDIVLATRNLCSHTANPQNDHLSSFEKPSLALKLGHALKKGAMILRGMALRQKDIESKQNVEMFLELLDSEWSTKISSAALRTLSDGQFNKAPVLPVTEDLMKLREHLLAEIPKKTGELLLKPEVDKWRC
ncbi:uncharacterized protein LOC135681426 isoform X3 [Rhopilema esculentum]|uniref:uncharacterized protein LOC135681426 isoform X3 n=1 Tax=Rhopilema esculentum TaxID=499914 RepID=UPI0031DA685D